MSRGSNYKQSVLGTGAVFWEKSPWHEISKSGHVSPPISAGGLGSSPVRADDALGLGHMPVRRDSSVCQNTNRHSQIVGTVRSLPFALPTAHGSAFITKDGCTLQAEKSVSRQYVSGGKSAPDSRSVRSQAIEILMMGCVVVPFLARSQPLRPSCPLSPLHLYCCKFSQAASRFIPTASGQLDLLQG